MKQVFLLIPIFILIISCGGSGGDSTSTTSDTSATNTTSGVNEGIKVKFTYNHTRIKTLYVNGVEIDKETILANPSYELHGNGVVEFFGSSIYATILDLDGFSKVVKIGNYYYDVYCRVPASSITYTYRYEIESNYAEVNTYYYVSNPSNYGTDYIKQNETDSRTVTTPFFGFATVRTTEPQEFKSLKIYKDDVLIFEKYNFTKLSVGGIDATDYKILEEN
jgi:hypothetical protein